MENTHSATSFSPIAEITNASSLPAQMQLLCTYLTGKYHLQNGFTSVLVTPTPLSGPQECANATRLPLEERQMLWILLELGRASGEGNTMARKLIVHGTSSFNT